MGADSFPVKLLMTFVAIGGQRRLEQRKMQTSFNYRKEICFGVQFISSRVNRLLILDIFLIMTHIHNRQNDNRWRISVYLYGTLSKVHIRSLISRNLNTFYVDVKKSLLRITVSAVRATTILSTAIKPFMIFILFYADIDELCLCG